MFQTCIQTRIRVIEFISCNSTKQTSNLLFVGDVFGFFCKVLDACSGDVWGGLGDMFGRFCFGDVGMCLDSFGKIYGSKQSINNTIHKLQNNPLSHVTSYDFLLIPYQSSVLKLCTREHSTRELCLFLLFIIRHRE